MTPIEPRDKNRRSAHVARVLRVAIAIRDRPRDIVDLAAELRCTSRTIRRDLAVLQEVHAPIVKVGESGSVYVMKGPVAFV